MARRYLARSDEELLRRAIAAANNASDLAVLVVTARLNGPAPAWRAGASI